jgi:hypothetical protein
VTLRAALLSSTAWRLPLERGGFDKMSKPHDSRNGLPGNPHGFGVVRIPRRLWNDPTSYGTTERMRRIVGHHASQTEA